MLAVYLSADEGTFEYPSYMIDLYNADAGCWTGMAIDGQWQPPVFVSPEKWLVGPPPSRLSGVTFPEDHYIELMFRSGIIDGPGDDILIIESGQCGEQALVFLTDGASQEYLLGMATAPNTGKDEPATLGFDISGLSLPFVPSAIRVLAVDMGGGSPGFDIANIRARVASECGEKACRPYPANGAGKVTPNTVLSWLPGRFAHKHIVYFGSSFSDVIGNAAPIAIPAQPQDANTFNPGTLQLGKRYYWRIDEVSDTNTNSTQIGDVWTFMVADDVILDDFESYIYNAVYATWKESGWAVLSTVENPFHSCWQAMLFYYYFDSIYYSEVLRTLSPPQDWASAGIKVLELWFQGMSRNSVGGQMYMVIVSGGSTIIVPYDGDPNNIAKESWQLWKIDLTSLAGLDLRRVEGVGIGFQAKQDQAIKAGNGSVYFDDVTLSPGICPDDSRPKADFNADCVVNFEDFDDMAFSWRRTGYHVLPVAAPKPPVLWYKFDGNVNDSAGTAHGQINGRATFAPGIHSQAISFYGKSSSVSVGNAAGVFSEINNAITIAFWQYGRETTHLNNTLCCSNYVYGVSNPAIAINLGCWRPPGRYNWDCGSPWSFDNRLGGHHRYVSESEGRWNYWAFTKDTQVGTGKMQIFLNGVLYDNRAGAESPIFGITSFEIGSGWYGGFDGLIDDFMIYDYALSPEEIAYVATNGTGVFDQQLDLPVDLDADNRVDFKDLAILAEDWLVNNVWP